MLVRDHCLAPERVDAPIYGGRYGSLFPDLPPLEVDEAALHALGRPGGPCDLDTFPDDPDAHVAAVWPFFGQFVAHDITADRSPVTHHGDADRVRNFRVPRANLEGLYGSGPVGSPYLYAKDDPAKLLLSADGNDVPRNREGIALIGDPRNDVHLFTSQMAVAFIKLHNRLVDRLRADGTAEDELFEEARRATTWHYQHVIVREFLPTLIGEKLTAELVQRRPQLYRVDGDPLPDPCELSGERGLRPAAGVPGPHGLPLGRAGAHGRLDPADRRRRIRPRAASQAHRRAPAGGPDRAADPDLGLAAGHGLRVAGQP
jgi:hypothetical protein